MNKLTDTSVALCIFLLALSCSALSINPQAQVAHQTETSPIFTIPTPIEFVIFVSSGSEGNLEKYNTTNLTQAQKDVDAFIRTKVNISDVNLKAAQGDGNRFVYTYENKTENKTQTWVISVRKSGGDETSSKSTHLLTEPTSQAGGNTTTPSTSTSQNPNSTAAGIPKSQNKTIPQSEPKDETPSEKFVITGINYTQTSTLNDQQKSDLEKRFKKEQKKLDQLEKKINKKLAKEFKQFEELQKVFDSWWH